MAEINRMTQAYTETCVQRFNNAKVGETIEIILKEFDGRLRFKRGLEESRLTYKRQTIVKIKHGLVPLTVEIDTQPYLGVVNHIFPLITRMLFTKLEYQTRKLFIP